MLCTNKKKFRSKLKRKAISAGNSCIWLKPIKKERKTRTKTIKNVVKLSAYYRHLLILYRKKEKNISLRVIYKR